ncbi:MAG TPA: zinc-dependent metalloprotease, partial [Terriglobales bacterium]|nr:zinc-dependent metalloprotease [Terriglobales bacterium]
LELERIEAFAPDAKIVVDDGSREVVFHVPDNAYYRGAVEGDLGAVAVLTGRAAGGVRGLIIKNGETWVLGDEPDSATSGRRHLRSRKVDLRRERGDRKFECGSSEESHHMADLTEALAEVAAPIEEAVEATAVGHTARVAIDTDYEFFQKFGNVADATDYVGDLFAYASTIYENEVNTSLSVSYLKLWTTSADPWTATSCDTILSQFRTYWINNNAGVSRSIAHMLSGKPTGCGVAYVGVLCNNTYGYGITAGMSGRFNIASPSVVWDILAVSHEIGHNFNSPHTHCYNGIGGSSDPVDKCYSGDGGCYSGATSLPCAAGSGGKCGTIMSYCHLLSGGSSNITMTFGLGFQHGMLPDRVPSRMRAHVLSRAASQPSCLQYIAPSTNPTATVPPAAATSTRTATASRTATQVMTPTRTPTRVPSSTPQVTSTSVATSTRPSTPTRTPTRTRTATITRTFTRTPSNTRTITATRTMTSTRTATRTRTPSRTPVFTRTRTPTRTPIPTRTKTSTRTPYPTRTPTSTAPGVRPL